MPNIKDDFKDLLDIEIIYLATCDLKGNPHVKPIWFVYYNEKIWFETDFSTRAFRNINENNKVMLCFGGKKTYLVWGKVKWYKESEAPVSYRELLWKKYKKEMDDSFINQNTGIFEVVVEKEKAWHYADKNWEDLL
jgi:uncharacterized pyridoxamine 5'-phosphate oxidase family protein